MFEITVFSSDSFSFDPQTTYGRILVIFDTLDQFKNVRNSPDILKVLNFSDEAQLQQFTALDSKASPGTDAAATVESFFFTGVARNLTKIVVIVLPLACSRHNSPARSRALADAVKGSKGSENTIILIAPSQEGRAFAQICAAGRHFPLFSLKSGDTSSSTSVITKADIVVAFPQGSTDCANIVRTSQKTIENIRLCQKLVDTPPNILNTSSYVDICREVASGLNCTVNVIQGKDLEAQGFGGLWGVGKASEHLPALVILSHVPAGVDASAQSVCLVGKGIVYDTGGLSIKTPGANMAGMKMDMAGSAAVLGAFATAVTVGDLKQPLHALLCLAENSVGPIATRPDDVHILLSGKSVEVNNTDAEGRLVLSDGCFYAYKHLQAEVIVDIATLTGAQLIATGKNHGAIYCNTDELEQITVEAGKYTGDLTFPIPYCPEFYRNEFRSNVADMKNSVADRTNAQSSCAGQFIGNHLEEYLQKGGQWVHVDMAGPAFINERGTGYGVALLFEITQRWNSSRK